MAFEEAIAGSGLLVILLLAALPYLLLLIALWRMGTGLKDIALALNGRPGQKSLNEAVTHVGNAVADTIEVRGRIAAALEKAPLLRTTPRQGP